MSTLDDGPSTYDPESDDAGEWLQANREYVERIADSDLPHSWVAQRLLDSVDEDAASNDSGRVDGRRSP